MKARTFFGIVFCLVLLVGSSPVAGAPQSPGAAAGGCVAGGAYDPICDVDRDDDVDVTDVQLVANHWGQAGAWTSDAWSLTGNAGTSPDIHFLGTTDNVAFEVRVNNQRALRLEPGSTSPNWIAGYSGNSVNAGVAGATIGGGGEASQINRVAGSFGTVGGGKNNEARGMSATVSGGEANLASGFAVTVGGGTNNVAGSLMAGAGNFATVGGGIANTASGEHATVGGGINNTASGRRATVPGGRDNTAKGDYSFAAGRRAKADHQGAFVWGDSTDAEIHSGNDDQFIVRANGGVWFGAVTTTTPFTPTIGPGIFISTSTGAYLSSGGNWTNASDRAAKANFTPVDGQEVLARLAEVPITSWNYKNEEASIRHIGPTAQDFYAAFGLGEDDRHISTLDADGVALAAIQGLYQMVQAKEVQIAALEAENAAQQARIDDLEARVVSLERAVGTGRQGEGETCRPADLLPIPSSSHLPVVLLGGLPLIGLVLKQRWHAWSQ